jgi:hypothetical protein
MSDSYYYYDNEYTTIEFGMVNIGAICWWNSLLQILFSLPAFNKFLLEREEEMDAKSTSVLRSAYISVIRKLIPYSQTAVQLPSNSNEFELASQKILSAFVLESRKRKQQVIDLHGQEGPANGLCVFLEFLYFDDIYSVFHNKYERIVVCTHCKDKISVHGDKSPYIDMYMCKEFKTKKDYEDHIRFHITELDSFKCEKCKTTMRRIERLERLKMLREVIILVYEKSERVKWFPDRLDFMSVDDKMLRYKLVGQIEHGGNYDYQRHVSSGHYWAKALRNSGWKTFNDQSVSNASYNPNKSVHMVIYHLFEHSDMTLDEKKEAAVK